MPSPRPGAPVAHFTAISPYLVAGRGANSRAVVVMSVVVVTAAIIVPVSVVAVMSMLVLLTARTNPAGTPRISRKYTAVAGSYSWQCLRQCLA